MTTPGPGGPGPAPLLVLAVGTAAADVAARWCGHVDRLRVLGDAADAGAVLDAELPRLTAGWRVLAVGSGRDVRTVRAAALARGALDGEVVAYALDAGDDVRVHCGACHHRFDARLGARDSSTPRRCPGCGVDLVVTAHDSRVHGAVLGAPRVP